MEQQCREQLPSRNTVRDWILHDASIQDDMHKSRSVTTWSTPAWRFQDSEGFFLSPRSGRVVGPDGTNYLQRERGRSEKQTEYTP